MAKAKGKSICIFSTKGGTGKSTTAINLAGVFSILGKSVLIIDFDTTSGSIGLLLNQASEKTIFNFVDDYANNRYQNISNYVTKYNDKISFLSACKDPRQASKISASYIEIVIEKAMFNYDVVIIDTNHILNEFNVTILDNSDEILLILNNELVALKNMRNLIQIFNDANKYNYKVLLNDSINPYKNYYSLYDIRNIIKANIDYTIGTNFFIKSFENYVVEGKIITLEKKMKNSNPKVYKTYEQICNDLVGDENE